MSIFEKISVELEVVLGTTSIPIHQLLRMGRGAVIELDAREADDLEILANDIPVARGQVVLHGDRIGINITEVLNRNPLMRPNDSVRKI